MPDPKDANFTVLMGPGTLGGAGITRPRVLLLPVEARAAALAATAVKGKEICKRLQGSLHGLCWKF
jgi:hypothetical protein